MKLKRPAAVPTFKKTKKLQSTLKNKETPVKVKKEVLEQNDEKAIAETDAVPEDSKVSQSELDFLQTSAGAKARRAAYGRLHTAMATRHHSQALKVHHEYYI